MIARDPTLTAYVEIYLRDRDVSAYHAELLFTRVRKFQEWLGAPIKVAELTDDIVSDFLTHLIESGLAKSTAKNYRAYILALWRSAYEDRLIDRLPTRVKKVKPVQREPEAWTHEEIHQLLAACDQMRGVIWGTNIPQRLFFRSWICGAYDSALRCSDQFGLLQSDVSLSGDFSRVQNKTGYSVRCQFSAMTMREIAAMEWSGPEVWPWKSRRRQFFLMAERLIKKAGIVGTLRRLRASAGSYRELVQPGSGHQLLGHRDSGVFRRHYEDRRITRGRPIAPPPLG